MIDKAVASGAENAIIGRITPLTLAELASMAGKSAKLSVLRIECSIGESAQSYVRKEYRKHKNCTDEKHDKPPCCLVLQLV
ncbi:hypothetical protein GCM10007927_03700 [Sulfitobacter pacificus]|uniref:Uncharacterized protein n=1 Tax=Sulfitobacter pacificus TaxID=1499314 RepID=A0ABQ5VFQ1_9RHOB|nr:hypothetical protein GCM10007927_03700 [Sulfitobacter pacificus]